MIRTFDKESKFLAMTIQISDTVIKSMGLGEKELKVEFASWLYARGIFTLAQAASFTGLTRLEMQKALDQRDIELHISPKDIDDDFNTLKSLNFK